MLSHDQIDVLQRQFEKIATESKISAERIRLLHEQFYMLQFTPPAFSSPEECERWLEDKAKLI